jgi:hypothetical protein
MILGPHRVLRATCLEANGQVSEANAIIEKVLDDVRNHKAKVAGYTEVTAYEDLSAHFAWRGDAKKALFWAARAFSKSPTGIEPRLLRSEFYEPVRGDADFSASIYAIQQGLYDRVVGDSQTVL